MTHCCFEIGAIWTVKRWNSGFGIPPNIIFNYTIMLHIAVHLQSTVNLLWLSENTRPSFLTHKINIFPQQKNVFQWGIHNNMIKLYVQSCMLSLLLYLWQKYVHEHPCTNMRIKRFNASNVKGFKPFDPNKQGKASS